MIGSRRAGWTAGPTRRSKRRCWPSKGRGAAAMRRRRWCSRSWSAAVVPRRRCSGPRCRRATRSAAPKPPSRSAMGHCPGAAAALAAGEASFEHVAALAAVKDRLPDGAAQSLLPLAATLPPDKFARAVQRAAIPTAETAEGSTGTTARGGRWFRFGFDGYEGTIVLNGLEAVMDRQWRAAHPDRADEQLERPPWGQRLAGALLELARDALAGHTRTVTDAPV